MIKKIVEKYEELQGRYIYMTRQKFTLLPGSWDSFSIILNWRRIPKREKIDIRLMSENWFRDFPFIIEYQ